MDSKICILVIYQSAVNRNLHEMFFSSLHQAVTSRAQSVVGRVTGTVCRVQTRPSCSKTGNVSPTVAVASTVEKASATVKLTNVFASLFSVAF